MNNFILSLWNISTEEIYFLMSKKGENYPKKWQNLFLGKLF